MGGPAEQERELWCQLNQSRGEGRVEGRMETPPPHPLHFLYKFVSRGPPTLRQHPSRYSTLLYFLSVIPHILEA
jgi:hypothetical protein